MQIITVASRIISFCLLAKTYSYDNCTIIAALLAVYIVSYYKQTKALP